MKTTILGRLKAHADRKYEGYIWGSDDSEPVLLQEETFPFETWKKSSSFILEALLYDKTNKVSVFIRHAPGAGKEDLQLHEFYLDPLPEGSLLEPVAYLPHRLKGVEKVCFYQWWEPEKDPNCMDMEVLKMKALIFSGFTPLSKTENNA